MAKALHFNSPRADRPFVPINCAAVPASLLESELFGHVKGAFTGAVGSRRGLFREAHGGTLFLDEIGDMAPELQAKLLRAIEDRSVRPVGSDQATPLDVRIIAATNQDLPARIRAGQFRDDLCYRLAVIPIQLPALRDRKEDIALLAEHFLGRAIAASGKTRASTPRTRPRSPAPTAASPSWCWPCSTSLATVALLAWAASQYLWHEYRGLPIAPRRLVPMALSVGAAAALSLLTFWRSMRTGIRALEELG